MPRWIQTSRFLIFSCTFCGLAISPVVGASPGKPSVDVVPPGLIWKEVAPSARSGILDFLATQTKSNYERINSWEGNYAVRCEEYLSPETVDRSFGNQPSKENTKGLIMARDRTIKVVIDMVTGSTYRDGLTTDFRLLKADSRENVTIPGAGPADDRAILTSESYLFFDPKQQPASWGVLPDNPRAMNKRAAHRVSPEFANKADAGALLDPRRLFCGLSVDNNWETLARFAASLRGERGPKSAKLSDTLHLDEASQGGGMWYRLRLLIPQNHRLITMILSPAAGFNPVSKIVETDEGGHKVINSTTLWNWRLVDGIFVPAAYSETVRSAQSDNPPFKRVVELIDCVLNKPISPNQFECSALGMMDGDLVLNDIDQTVLIISDGKPKRLAAYHEQYVPPTAGRFGVWLIVVNAIALGALVVAFCVRRFKTQKAT